MLKYMRSPSELDITLFNATINAYLGKRPKKPERKYNIKEIFNKMGTNFPLKLKSSVNMKYVNYINIEAVSVCLPGGRGCVGKERLGTKLTNRQTAMKNNTGVYYSPLTKDHNENNPKSYGFLQLSGKIMYKDGYIGNINVPVDASGIIGLRTGASKNIKINPLQNNANNAQTDFIQMIDEIKMLLLKRLNIKDERPTRLEMVNANFNLYTKKKKVKQTDPEPRPHINNFESALDMIHNNMKTDDGNHIYKRASKKWLTAQGQPSVMKGIYKPIKNDKKYPTISMSAYGLVEIMGSSSFKSLFNGYKKIFTAFKKIEEELNIENAVITNKKEGKRSKTNKIDTNMKIETFNMNTNILKINGKPCLKYSKSHVAGFSKQLGMSNRGTKKELCEKMKEMKERFNSNHVRNVVNNRNGNGNGNGNANGNGNGNRNNRNGNGNGNANANSNGNNRNGNGNANSNGNNRNGNGNANGNGNNRNGNGRIRISSVPIITPNRIVNDVNKMKEELSKMGITLLKENLTNKSNENIKSNFKKYSENTMIRKQNENKNSINYKIPPKLERIKAMIGKGYSRPVANLYSNDPFHSFNNLMYMKNEPIRGDSTTWPTNHNVYKISKYFPAPINGLKKTIRR